MRFLLLFLAAALLAGCPNTDTAVFVDPKIEAAELTVTPGVLGTSVKGSFTLKLHLGARASGSSQVSTPTFSIEDPKKSGALSVPIAVDGGATQFPVTVEPDSDVTVTLTFDTGAKPLSKDLATPLCDPAGVIIAGTIEDSLQDTATPVESAVLHPCM